MIYEDYVIINFIMLLDMIESQFPMVITSRECSFSALFFSPT